MNKPPADWPFTGRFYPDGVTLSERKVSLKFIDLCWYDPKRDVWVYLSSKRA